MGVARSFLEILKAKVFGGRSHAEGFAAAVDGVGTIIDRGFQALRLPAGDNTSGFLRVGRFIVVFITAIV